MRSCQGLTEVVNSKFPTEPSFAGGNLGRVMHRVLGQSLAAYSAGDSGGMGALRLAHPLSDLGTRSLLFGISLQRAEALCHFCCFSVPSEGLRGSW